MRRWTCGGTLILGVACAPPPVSPQAVVRPGLEVLVSDSAHLVRGLRVGLVTNQAGVDRRGIHGVTVLQEHGVNLVALFSPEHGFRGQAAPGAPVATTVDSATGLPIYSLYGDREPALNRIAGLGAVLVDLQDVGARYFTWIVTAVDVMRAAQAAGVRVIILDRPNPIGGVVQGNVLDPAWRSGVGALAVPMRHGLTFGELVRLAHADLGLTTDLHVVPVAGWQRAMRFERTGLPFVPPSPNLRDLEALFHYPGLCLFEATDLSVGRGTDSPFRQVGAPWLDTTAVLARVRSRRLPGVEFAGVAFRPSGPGDGKYDGIQVAGIRLRLTDPDTYDPTVTGVVLLVALQAVHPDRIAFDPPRFDRLAGGPELRERLVAGIDEAGITASWRASREAFLTRREAVLLYP